MDLWLTSGVALEGEVGTCPQLWVRGTFPRGCRGAMAEAVGGRDGLPSTCGLAGVFHVAALERCAWPPFLGSVGVQRAWVR